MKILRKLLFRTRSEPRPCEKLIKEIQYLREQVEILEKLLNDLTERQVTYNSEMLGIPANFDESDKNQNDGEETVIWGT